VSARCRLARRLFVLALGDENRGRDFLRLRGDFGHRDMTSSARLRSSVLAAGQITRRIAYAYALARVCDPQRNFPSAATSRCPPFNSHEDSRTSRMPRCDCVHESTDEIEAEQRGRSASRIPRAETDSAARLPSTSWLVDGSLRNNFDSGRA